MRFSSLYLLPLVLLVLSVRTVNAASEAGQLQLEWTAPAQCPDRAAVERRLEVLLGEPAGSLLSRNFLAVAVIAAKPDGFELHLQTQTADGEQGSRRLTAATCERLAAAGAVIIALAISPEAVRKHAPEASAAFDTIAEPEPGASGVPVSSSSSQTRDDDSLSPQAHQPAAPLGVAATAASVNTHDPASPGEGAPKTISRPSQLSGEPRAPGPPEPAIEEASRLVVGLSGNIDGGTLPGVAPGAALALGWDWGNFRVELDAVLLPARFAAAAAGEPSKGGSISLYAAGPGFCYRLLSGIMPLSACAGAEYGRMHGVGRNLREEKEQNVPWLAARAGLALGLVQRGPFTLRARAQAVVPFGRRSFKFRREDMTFEELHRPARVAARLGLGFELAF